MSRIIVDQIEEATSGNGIQFVNPPRGPNGTAATDYVTKSQLDAVDENTTAINVGTSGQGIFSQKTIDQLEFFKINPGSTLLTIVLDAPNDKIDIDAVEANFTLDNIGGTLSISKGGTGQITQTLAFDSLSPNTTKGDVTVYNGTNSVRISVGINGQVFRANSSVSEGIEWQDDLTVSNEGTSGVGLFDTKNGTVFEFKGIDVVGSFISIAENITNKTVEITVVAIQNSDVSGSAAIESSKLDLTSITQSIGGTGFLNASSGSGDVGRVPKLDAAGKFSDTMISSSSVTQHEGSIDHNALTNYSIGQHRIINDASDSAIELLSAQKINNLIASVVSGFDVKDPVDTSTEGVGNISLSGEQTLNGFLTSASRVAVIEQTDASENGYYESAPGAWSRTSDADTSEKVSNGMLTYVGESGSVVFKHRYLLTTPDPIDLGVTDLTFAVFRSIDFGTTAGTATEGNDSRVPIQDENDALVGTNGTPSTSNKYVTNSDSRNSDARTPLAHNHVVADITDAGTAATKTVGNASGNLQENGASLGNTQTVETDGTGKFISSAKGTAYNKEFGTAAGTVSEGDDTRIPIQDENDALVGTDGTPSTSNKYVTDSDPRVPVQDENDALIGTDGTPSTANKFITNSDPRISTQDENDALVGTNGAPSTSNKYITDSDTRIPIQDENDALVGTDGTPSTSNKYVTDSDPRLITEIVGTGVLTGGIGSVGSPTSTFSISDGTGTVLDMSTPATPNVIKFTWSGLTNVTLPDIGSQSITFVGINSTSTIQFSSTQFTPVQRRSIIPLFVAVHTDNLVVSTIDQEQEVAAYPASQSNDLASAIGFFNGTGNVFGPSGADLTLSKTLGVVHKTGAGYENSGLLSPNLKILPFADDQSFTYGFQAGANGATGTNIDPDIWDVAGVSTAVAGGKYTVQWIFVFVNGDVRIQPGQVEYNDVKKGREGLLKDVFVIDPAISQNGLLRGFLVIEEGTTDIEAALASGDAQFLEADKFGVTTGFGGSTLVSLQDAFDNSTNPEIVVPSGSDLTIESATDGAQIIQEWRDETSTVTASMTGDGDFTATNYVGVNQSMIGLEINAQTGTTYTLVDSDHGKLVTLDNAASIALTLNTGLRNDFACVFLQKGAGQITIAGTASINEVESLSSTAGQWAIASVTNLGSDVYVLQGRLT